MDDLLMRLARLSEPERYGSTWAGFASSELFDNLECLRYWLPMFWLTPLAGGLVEGALSKVDRVFQWAQPRNLDYIVSRYAFDTRQLPRLPFDDEIESVAQLHMEQFRGAYKVGMVQASDLYRGLRDCTDIDFSLAIKPNVIGAIQYDYDDGVFYNGNTLKYIRFLHLILNNSDIFNQNKQVVLEIGAGYGGFVELIANHFKNCNFIIIDIPETLAISSYYLTKSFPEMTWKLHDDNQRKININDHKINFIPHNMVHLLRDEEIDLVVNSNSLVEMPNEEIIKYFDLIQDSNKVKYFWYANGVKSSYAISSLEDMPFDENWEVILEQFSLSKNETGMEPADFMSKYFMHPVLFQNKELLLKRVAGNAPNGGFEGKN